MSQDTPSGRGGARPGAGRKRVGSQRLEVRLKPGDRRLLGALIARRDAVAPVEPARTPQSLLLELVLEEAERVLGAGAAEDLWSGRCPDCRGQGSVPYEGEAGDAWTSACGTCAGTGRIP